MKKNEDLQLQITAMNEKLDLLVAQMQEQQRRQQEFEELKNDLTFIAKDAMKSVIAELEEVTPPFNGAELRQLLKRLARNTGNFNRMLDQLESLSDFAEDVRPLGKHAFSAIISQLDEMDRKGYFIFLKEAMEIVDTVITSFTVDDVRLLRENITSILLTVKNLTQPDMLSTMNNAVGFYKKMDIDVDHDVSYRTIIKELKDPEVKRGLVFLLEFVKSMAMPGELLNHQKATNNN